MAFVGGAVLVFWLADSWLALPLLLLALFCLYFFRDPERMIPDGPHVVAPADGTVTAVNSLSPTINRISIFLSVFDVHVVRSPIGGEITKVEYQKGRFLPASFVESSLQNEHNIVTIQGDDTSVVFKQIAGIIVRRIICTKTAGDRVSIGERVGLIKFGSRVDVFLGTEWEIIVHPGGHVLAGATIIARRCASKSTAASCPRPAVDDSNRQAGVLQ